MNKEYATIMVKENSTENLGLLTEKLNAGFHIDCRIDVGRSLLIVLRKYIEEETEDRPNVRARTAIQTMTMPGIARLDTTL